MIGVKDAGGTEVPEGELEDPDDTNNGPGGPGGAGDTDAFGFAIVCTLFPRGVGGEKWTK